MRLLQGGVMGATATAVRVMTAATRACIEYELWAAEIKRLTDQIGRTVCPNEVEPTDDFDPDGDFPLGALKPSCFRHASDTLPRQPDRPVRLDDIARAVADCPECSRLCELIAARKEARKRFGVAKRRVRHAGKILMPTGEEARDGE